MIGKESVINLKPKIDKKKILSLIKNKINIFDDDIIYLCGSNIESQINPFSKNIGNVYSDTDVGIIRSKKDFNNTAYSTYSKDFLKNIYIESENIQLDIEVYNAGFVSELLCSLDQLTFNTGVKTRNQIKLNYESSIFEINDFLSRFKNSICIFSNTKYQDMKAKLNFPSFIEIYKLEILNSISNDMDDAMGNIHSNKYNTALYIVRKIFWQFLKYLILMNNEFIDRDKWVFEKFNNIREITGKYQDVYRQYINLFLNPNKQDINDLKLIIKFIQFSISKFSLEIED